MMSVPINTSTAFSTGVARPLFQTRVPSVGNMFRTNYEVSADGRRFLVNTVLDGGASPAISVVLNWIPGSSRRKTERSLMSGVSDRRAFLAFFASTGLSATLLPGVLWAQMQPGTKKVTIEMVRESARLAGLAWTDEECQSRSGR